MLTEIKSFLRVRHGETKTGGLHHDFRPDDRRYWRRDDRHVERSKNSEISVKEKAEDIDISSDLAAVSGTLSQAHGRLI